MHLRAMTKADRSEVAELIYVSLNYWYQTHGRPAIMSGGPQVAEVFFDVYDALDPGCGVVAVNERNDRLMGSCFYHPRTHHVSLGIMNVHPNYFGTGVGKALLRYIIDYTDRNGFRALRLTQSALNLDSFSLYTTAGFVPRWAFQDMYLSVPSSGLGWNTPDLDRVRDATCDDVPAMAALEMEISGIERQKDYRYCIENQLGFWHASVYEKPGGGLDGFLISCGHPAMNMLGPGVARSDDIAVALIGRELAVYPGRSPVFLVPVERSELVSRLYRFGARNCELHFCQVRGEFRPFRGISMPTFLPETG